MERLGYCCSCGQCCRDSPFAEWALPCGCCRYVIDTKIEHVHSGEDRPLTGRFKCTLGDSRPQICRDFPASPDLIKDYPNCTYRFV